MTKKIIKTLSSTLIMLLISSCSAPNKSNKMIFDCNEVLGDDPNWVRTQIKNDLKKEFKYHLDSWLPQSSLRLDDERAARIYPATVTSSGGFRYIVLYQFDPKVDRCRGFKRKFIRVIPVEKN